MGLYLLGIDIGTSACKATLFRKTGEVRAAASRAYDVYYPQAGWAEQNPDEWWRAVCGAIGELLEVSGVQGSEIAGIGIDGQSWSAVAVDGEGRVLTNTPIWMDTRAAGICEELNHRLGMETVFALAGNSLQPSYTTGKILWYQRNLPSVYRDTKKILQSNSYIAYKLTGRMTQDLSQGYGYHCFDMHRGTWDDERCAELGLERGVLPDIYACHEVIGGVTAGAAGETGLMEGTPVVAGGLDAACGALGAGVIQAGETQEQGGQAGGMSICNDEYKADPRLILSRHVVSGKWLLQGGTTGGGGVMKWLEREFADYEREEGRRWGKSSFDLFNELADVVPAGSDGLVFLPYMMGERSPIWNPDARGVYYGLDFGKTKGHILRAAMEGVALSLRHNIEVAEEAGASVFVLRAMGGSANSILWTQIKSDVTGKPVVVPSADTATTLGAAILAGVGVGVYRDFEEAVGLTVKNRRYHVPNEDNRKVYDKNYQVYRTLYEQLKEMMSGT